MSEVNELLLGADITELSLGNDGRGYITLQVPSMFVLGVTLKHTAELRLIAPQHEAGE